MSKEIASAEQTLKSLGGLERIQTEIDATQEKLRVAQEKYDSEEEKDVNGKRRGRNKRREEKAARLASIQKEIEGLQTESGSYTEKIDTLTSAKEAKKSIGERSDALRLKIFEDFAPAKEILEKAKKAAEEKLNAMILPKGGYTTDLKKAEEAQQYFEKLTSATAFDYTEDWDLELT